MPSCFYTYRDAFRSLYMKKIVFTFGRFNPPTTGHHLLANKVKDIADKRNADYKIFGSSSQDAKRNPLSPTDKFRFMKKILKGFNVAVDRNNKTPFQVLQQLSDEGYEDVTMVVGSDRVTEFKQNMSRYIGKKGYENISKFNVVSAGDRDPDAEGVTGMSASKMRAAAEEGNFSAFRVGMPRHVSERDAKGLFNAIRKGMGIRGKIQESSWFDFDEYQEFSEQMQLDEGFLGKVMKKITPKPVRMANIKKLRVKATERKIKKLHGKADDLRSQAQSEPNKGNLPGLDLKWHKYDQAINQLGDADKKRRTLSTKQGREIQRTTPTQNELDFARKQRKHGRSMNENLEQLDELSIQARRKLARRMKVTAKKRAMVRKRKEKRRKTKDQLVAKANKQAVMKVRQKLLRGMKWKDVPYLQREKIDAKVKKKKARIAVIAKRLMPSMQKQEKERLEKVRARMTTNNPKKAIAPTTESIDVLFEEMIDEASQAGAFRRAARNIGGSSPAKARSKNASTNRKTNSEQEKAKARGQSPEKIEAGRKKDERADDKPKVTGTDPVAVSIGNRVEIIQAKQVNDNHKVLSGDKPVTNAQQYSKMPGFVCGPTAKSLLGGKCPEGTEPGNVEGQVRSQLTDPEGERRARAAKTAMSGEPAPQPTAAEKKLAKAQTDLAQRQTELQTRQTDQEIAQMDQQNADMQAQMDAVQAKQYSNTLGKILGVPTEQPKKDTKLISKKNGQFEDWHKAVDMEAAVVAVANGCTSKRTEKTMRACLAQSGIAEADMIKLAASPTLIPSAMRMMDRVSMQLPKGMVWKHTGTGMGDIRISDTYYNAGASDITPKTDLQACNEQTGECLNLSMKIGPGQLMSGQKGEASATMDVVLNRLRGCKGSPPTDCTQKLGKGDKQLLNKLEGVKKQIKEQFEKGQLGRGMGPSSWWLTGQIGGRKPSWWDRSGPGAMGLDYEDAKGQNPKDLQAQGFFPAFTKEEEKKLQTANKAHKQIAESLRDIFSSGEFGETIKQNIMYEAMTGCGKFCEDCCGLDVCKNCQNAAAATHMIVGNKDGTGGTIKEIGLPGSDFMKKMSAATNVDIRFKTGQPEKSVRGWISDMAENLKAKLPAARGKDEGAKLNKKEEKQLTDVLSYAGIELKPGEWNKMSLKKKKQILSKSKKMGGYNFNSVMGLGSDFALGGPVQTFLEFNGDVQEEGGSFQDAMQWIGDDPAKLLEFMGYDIEIDTPHEDLADTFSEEDSGKSTTITVDGEQREVPVMKDVEYKDYQKDYEETGEYSQDMNESFRLLTEPDILDRLVTQLKDRGMDNAQAHAVARSQLQKHGVLKQGSEELTTKGKKRNAMGAAGRAKDRAAKRSGKSVGDYKYNPQTNTATLKEDDCGCMNEAASMTPPSLNVMSNTARVMGDSSIMRRGSQQQVARDTIRGGFGSIGRIVNQAQRMARAKRDKYRVLLSRSTLRGKMRAQNALDKTNQVRQRGVQQAKEKLEKGTHSVQVPPKTSLQRRMDARNVETLRRSATPLSQRVPSIPDTPIRPLPNNRVGKQPSPNNRVGKQPSGTQGLSESRLRSDVYALVNKKGKVTHANLTKKNAHKEVGNQGNKHTILLDPDAKEGDDRPKYAFKESTIQGIGTFASSDISEGDMVGLYYLNLLEESPRYQRTDLCRLTNHSHHNGNLSLINVDGNIYAFANKNIQEGEEIFIDYFHVGETILPLLKEDGLVIHEVLRWTSGYDDMLIGEEQKKHDLIDELALFVEMGDCPKYIKQTLFYEKLILPRVNTVAETLLVNSPTVFQEDEDPVKRAKRLKKYNAQPEQRKRRSARTNERNKRIRKGQLAVGDGKDIDHKDGNPLNNSPDNISITSVKHNRGRNNNKGRTNEEHGAGEMGTKELLKKYLKDTPHMTIDDKFIKEMS